MQERTTTQGKILIPEAGDIDAAIKVSQWMEGKPMLRKTPEEVRRWFTEARSILIVGIDDGIPVAHAALTLIYPPSDTGEVFGELGGVVVDPNKYGQRFGSAAVAGLFEYAKETFGHLNLFALCNTGSLNIFLREGAKIMTDAHRLPKEVWKECAQCPSFAAARAAGKYCCDTPVLIYEAKK